MNVPEVLRVLAWWLSTVVVVVYLVAAALVAAVAIRSMIRPQRLPASRAPVADAVLGVIAGRPPLRQQLELLLRVASESLTWPAVAWQRSWFALRRSNLEAAARMQLRPVDAVVSVSTVVLLVLVAGLAVLDVLWRPAVLTVAGAAVGATAARHLSYLVGSLPAALRRSRSSPLPQLLAIAAADACTLTLGVTLLRWTSGGPSIVAQLSDTFWELFSVTGPLGDLRESTMPDALTLLGLLYWAALINSLRSRSALERTDADIRTLAAFCVVTGDLAGAQSWLQKEKDRNATSFAIRGRLALAQGRFPEAMRLAVKLLDVQGEDACTDRAAILTLDWLLMDSADGAVRAGHLRHLMAVGVADGVTSWAANGVAGDFPDVVAGLLADQPWSAYPLTHGVLLAAAGDVAGAYSVTERAQPASPFDHVVRQINLCTLVAADPDLDYEQTRSGIAMWSDTVFPDLLDVAPDVGEEYRGALLSVIMTLAGLVAAFAEGDPPELLAETVTRLAALAGLIAQSEEQLALATRAADAGIAALLGPAT